MSSNVRFFLFLLSVAAIALLAVYGTSYFSIIDSLSLGSILNTGVPTAVEGKAPLTFRSVTGGDFWEYTAPSVGKNPAIIVVNHGMFSNGKTAMEAAESIARLWQGFADETGAVIVSPVWDNHRYAVTVDGPQKWGYRGLFGRYHGADVFLNEIILSYGHRFPEYDGRFFLSGHSAGAQFANRYLVRHYDRILAASFSSPAWFALPTDRFQWPNGMKQRFQTVRWSGEKTDRIVHVEPEPIGWLRAATIPVTVVVGEADTKALRHVDGVGGDTHVERAKYWVQSMNRFAAKNGAEGTVAVKVVPGIGHNMRQLTGYCQQALREHVMKRRN